MTAPDPYQDSAGSLLGACAPYEAACAPYGDLAHPYWRRAPRFLVSRPHSPAEATRRQAKTSRERRFSHTPSFHPRWSGVPCQTAIPLWLRRSFGMNAASPSDPQAPRLLDQPTDSLRTRGDVAALRQA
jgi:hypothetical protein